MATNAEKIMSLFAGNQSHHGTHGAPDLDQNGVKWTIKRTARTLREKVTLELWQQHLDGKRPLGIVPIMDDSKCWWGSIDIDDYDVDALDVVERIGKAKLPLVPCRSKSGGLHLFLFVSEPVEASLMRSVLSDIAASLGFGQSEIFPKQTQLHVEKGDQGNWIVMPYFGSTYDGKLRAQHGLKKTGAEMTITEFISIAEKMRVKPDQMTLVRAKKPKKERLPFSDGPPCLVHLASLKDGIPQGGQNNTAFHMGVYFKRAHPEDWREKLEEANRKFMRPPLPSDNLAGVIKSLEKKDYQYKCKDQPMVSHCDAMQCRMRKFGVGAGASYPIITGLAKLNTEPAIWFVDVEGARLVVSTEELQTYIKFHRHCMEYTNKAFAIIPQAAWFSVLNDAMANLTIIPAPSDVGTAGRFLEALETYLTNRQRGLTKEDLLSGRPWEDEEHHRHYFRLSFFQKFLEREGIKDIKRGEITIRIEKLGGAWHGMNIKGKYVNTWWIPSEVLHRVPDADTPPIKGDKM